MVAPRFAKLFAVAVSAALVCSMAGVPAYALTDTNLDEMAGASAGVSAITPTSTDESSSLQNQPSADDAESMPDNPTKDLPQTVSEAVPDDATVVSEELAVTDSGDVMDLETGDTVTDPQLVGTVDKPADPLAKTDGESFIPVEVAEVKEAMGDAAAEAEPDDAADTEDDGDVAESQQDATDEGAAGAVVRPAALQNNSYGAYWGTYSGTPAFFEADGTLFVQQAKGVIDVSEWQGQIDWQKAKNDGVEGAIIRISYGWGNGFDKQALRNISECKRLGIPFGIYSYSYAYDSTTAAYEGADMVSLLRQAGAQPGDLSYPVFYDLEKWTWTGHTPPASPSVYDGIVNAWYAKLQAAGYTNLSVYSYTSYLDTALNSANIRNKTRWVASYGARTNFPYAANDRGWQYTSQGSVAGIQGSVDLNAFGNKTYVPNTGSGWLAANGKQYWYENGRIASNKEVFDPGSNAWYWVDADGAMARGMRYIPSNGGKWVYYDWVTGQMAHGERYVDYDREHTGWYYFDPVTGAMAKGMRHLDSNGGKWVYYDWITGIMAHGERYVDYDKEHTGWYLFDQTTGAMYHGDVYIQSNGGKWVRYDRITGKMVKGLHRQDDAWYYFDPVTGAMQRGDVYVPEWDAYHHFDTLTGRG
ncbi:GH25 family lysozyme [uncultured Bifidobacterium sp.]|uniref:GH25 family lysozyme n=1 Tax=uncultured Bifidobacterium sp. TaxID=165187 RepID=UPI002585DE27|nr:GH25 family lysozyme [uncultured Bifidobacterium sp.]